VPVEVAVRIAVRERHGDVAARVGRHRLYRAGHGRVARDMNAEHREPEERRLGDLLLVQRVHVRADDREVIALAFDEGVADRDRSRCV
jgi:hypothetical protein